MRVYKDSELEEAKGRTHPWTVSQYAADHRYYDFRSHPDLISEVLEDFMPYNDQPAIREFYDLLRWVNGPDCALETNDCAFLGPRLNPDKQFAKAMRTDGRLMLFFRWLDVNCIAVDSQWLEDCFEFHLQRVEPGFNWGCIALTKQKTFFKSIERKGLILMLTFWAWGDSEQETMDNLQITFRGLRTATERVDMQIKEHHLYPQDNVTAT